MWYVLVWYVVCGTFWCGTLCVVLWGQEMETIHGLISCPNGGVSERPSASPTHTPLYRCVRYLEGRGVRTAEIRRNAIVRDSKSPSKDLKSRFHPVPGPRSSKKLERSSSSSSSYLEHTLTHPSIDVFDVFLTIWRSLSFGSFSFFGFPFLQSIPERPYIGV